MQLYREEGWYLSAPHYVARVGLDYVETEAFSTTEGRPRPWARL